MGARSVYLRVAELLRAQHAPVETRTHRHSGLALRLRTDVIDSGIKMDARLKYFQAWVSLHAHPKADFEEAGDKMSKLYYNALNELPYLTQGKSGDDIKRDALMDAVARFKAYRDKILKPGSEQAPVPERPQEARKRRQIPV